jgi:hypothetical protein
LTIRAKLRAALGIEGADTCIRHAIEMCVNDKEQLDVASLSYRTPEAAREQLFALLVSAIHLETAIAGSPSDLSRRIMKKLADCDTAMCKTVEEYRALETLWCTVELSASDGKRFSSLADAVFALRRLKKNISCDGGPESSHKRSREE